MDTDFFKFSTESDLMTKYYDGHMNLMIPDIIIFNSEWSEANGMKLNAEYSNYKLLADVHILELRGEIKVLENKQEENHLHFIILSNQKIFNKVEFISVLCLIRMNLI